MGQLVRPHPPGPGAEGHSTNPGKRGQSQGMPGGRARLRKLCVTDVPGNASLGLVSGFLPPDPVILKSVLPGSWADENGIEAGDELAAIGSRDVCTLMPGEIEKLMRTRPVDLHF